MRPQAPTDTHQRFSPIAFLFARAENGTTTFQEKTNVSCTLQDRFRDLPRRFLGGVIWGAVVAGVPHLYIGIGALIFLGIGISSTVSGTRSKDPS